MRDFPLRVASLCSLGEGDISHTYLRYISHISHIYLTYMPHISHIYAGQGDGNKFLCHILDHILCFGQHKFNLKLWWCYSRADRATGL